MVTKPVTNHRNIIRVWIRSWMPEKVWKLILWRPIYNRRIQTNWAVWFIFFMLLIAYWCYVGMWILDIVVNEYHYDSTFNTIATVNLFWCWYIAVSWMSLEMIIMFVVLIAMLIIWIFWFWWLLFCPKWLAETSGYHERIDRDYILRIISADGSWEAILNCKYFNK